MQKSILIVNKFREIAKKVDAIIASEPDNFIAGSSINELVEYYFSPYDYEPLELDRTQPETIDIKRWRKTIRAADREWAYQHDGDLIIDAESAIVRMPIKSNSHLDILKYLEPTTYISGFSGGNLMWAEDAISFSLPMIDYGINKPNEQIKKEIGDGLQWVQDRLHYIASELEGSKEVLKIRIRDSIQNRKSRVEEAKGRHEALLKIIEIPLRKKEDEVVKRIQLNPKPIVQRIRPKPQASEEYVLDHQKVLDIIEFIDNQGRQFEKTPKSYENLGEEDLRDILLVSLNGIFEGRATGETFSRNGKTDVHLSLDKGNILCAECKFWTGQKGYHQTIDQLLGYLTWRMNFGIIILFTRNKDFSHVVSGGRHAIQGHSTYKKGFQELKPAHFMSLHYLPGDEQKYVEMHHLFYNLSVG